MKEKVDQIEKELRHDWTLLTDDGRKTFKSEDKYIIHYLKMELSNALEDINHAISIIQR